LTWNFSLSCLPYTTYLGTRSRPASSFEPHYSSPPLLPLLTPEVYSGPSYHVFSYMTYLGAHTHPSLSFKLRRPSPYSCHHNFFLTPNDCLTGRTFPYQAFCIQTQTPAHPQNRPSDGIMLSWWCSYRAPNLLHGKEYISGLTTNFESSVTKAEMAQEASVYPTLMLRTLLLSTPYDTFLLLSLPVFYKHCFDNTLFTNIRTFFNLFLIPHLLPSHPTIIHIPVRPSLSLPIIGFLPV
jgi:hypothetical protein